MADNIAVRDGNGAAASLASKDVGSLVHATKHILVNADGTTAIDPANASRSANIDDAADVTLNNGSETSILGSDATRREAIIVADPANAAGGIRIGKTGQVGAARGALLAPGQQLRLPTTAAIFGFAGAAGQKVSIVILKD